MTERINEKLLKHEFRINQIEKAIMTLEQKHTHMSNTLDAICMTLKQLKTIAITGIFFLILSSIGLIDTIKAFL